MDCHQYKTPLRSVISEFSLRSRPPKIKRYQAGINNDLIVESETSSIKPSLAVSEFSLRSRPSKVRRYQAGISNNLVVEGETTSKNPKRETRRGRSCFRDSDIIEDSIESDVLTIAMSYPEGLQRMLEKDHDAKCKKSTQDFSGRLGDKEDVPLPIVNFSLDKGKYLMVEGNNSPVVDGNNSSIVIGNNSLMIGRNNSPMLCGNNSSMLFGNNAPMIDGNNSALHMADANKSFPIVDGSNSSLVNGNNSPMVDGNNSSEFDRNNSPMVDLNNSNMVDGNNSPIVDENNSTMVDENYSPMVDGNNSPMLDENNNMYSSDDEMYYYDNMLNFRESETNEKMFRNGSIVWGKFSKKRWWPGLVIAGPMAGQKVARPGWTWLMWFHDHKISQVRLCHVVEFANKFREHSKGKLSPALERAIVEALQVCADRAGISVQGFESVKRWGLLDTGFLNLVESADETDLFTPEIGSEIPSILLSELKKLRREADVSDTDSDEESPLLKYLCHSETLTEHCEPDVDFCLSCTKHGKNIVCHHPIFQGYVCCKCKNSLMESLLAIDTDGFYLFCAVCGKGGEMYVCEEKDCGRTFCVRCLKHYLSLDDFELVRKSSPWSCFLCNKLCGESHTGLVPRDGWEDELIKFYNPVFDQVDLSTITSSTTRRKMRVLSLFDGIGYVKLALDQLHLDVEVYFSVETDPIAQHISRFNQGSTIVQLGDFDKITTEKLEKICPIHLVVARPPTVDLDVTNRNAEGFNGTGIKMLKVIDILKKIEFICKGNNSVYFLVESSSTVRSEYRAVLSNFFEREPCMWDAQVFSPYIHPKLYWGNIPGLYSSFQYYKDSERQFSSLESYLAKNVDRSAQIKKLRGCAIAMNRVKEKKDKDINEEQLNDPLTDEEMLDKNVEETVNSNQREVLVSGCKVAGHVASCQGELLDEILVAPPVRKTNIDDNTMFTLPVKMNGKDTDIWPIEVEKILGLPIHYTDAAITVRQRQKYLMDASSVLVLKHLLTPLTETFSTHS